MNSRSGAGQPYTGASNKSSKKGKNIPQTSSPAVDQLSHTVGDMSLDSDKDGGWEVCTRKNNNKTGGNASKAPPSSNVKAWGAPADGGSGKVPSNVLPRPAAGRGNGRNPSVNRAYENNYSASPAIPPPLERGWNWNSRFSSTQPSGNVPLTRNNPSSPHPHGTDQVGAGEVEDENDSDELDASDDDLLSDDYDSDESQKSHETRKQSKWFNDFFQIWDTMTADQINEPARQWHCPACKNGPGAIDWYRSLQALVTHAKTKGSKRVKLHRDFANLMEEELRRKGTSVVPAGEAFGQWKGLNEIVIDKEIIWPPMVIVMNTRLEENENGMWIGMGNTELLEYFSSYAAVKARPSYGPQGHRGMSVLIFEASAVGYAEAERLSKHFEDQGTDRDAWEHRRMLFYPGGKRQLYGYMAEKRDMEFFNQHSQGKAKVKFDMVSYQEKVVSQLKKMSEDNQLLLWFKSKVAKEQMHTKALEESLGLMSQKLRKTEEESRIVREKTQMHNKQTKRFGVMEFQEQFFKEQIKIIQEDRVAKVDKFEQLQQLERQKAKQSCEDSSAVDDPQQREEKLANFINAQNDEMEEYAEEKEKLVKMHEEKKLEMKQRHRNEELALEKEFNDQLSQLMGKYTPHHV